MPRILAFAGSARRESFNKRILAVAAQGARDAGADVTVLDMADYPLPIMDQDLEGAEGLPERVIALKEKFIASDGLLIACPEYNSSITPLLKNVIDWVSRPREGEPSMAAFKDKTAALIAASPGGLGGLRGLNDVRGILCSIGTHVIPDQVAVPNVHEKLDGESFIDDALARRLAHVGARLVEFSGRLAKT